MYAVRFTQRLRLDTHRNYIATVEPGPVYLLTDHHVLRNLPEAVCAERCRWSPHRGYRGQPLHDGSLAILWLAGLGDTVALAPALLSLQANNPQARVQIITVPALHEVLQAAGFRGPLIPYPATESDIQGHDFFVALEGGSSDPQWRCLDSIDFRARQLHQPAGLPAARFDVPEAADTLLPPTTRRRVGVHVAGLSPLRCLPVTVLQDLLRALVRRGDEVHLLGAAGECGVPSAPPLLYNDCGTTPNFAETLARVRRMDVMICPDSYLMHLAGTLRIPTVAVFSTIPPELRAARYPGIVALQPQSACAPCFAVEDHRCPLGHDGCVALLDPAVSAEAILEAMDRLPATPLPAGSPPISDPES